MSRRAWRAGSGLAVGWALVLAVALGSGFEILFAFFAFILWLWMVDGGVYAFRRLGVRRNERRMGWVGRRQQL